MCETKSFCVLNLVTYLLVIVGAVNWGLVGAFDFDLVAYIFGAGSVLAKAVYVTVGLSAIVSLGLVVSKMLNRTSD